MALTELKIRNAKANGKVQKLYDERGLLLYITANGGKYWRFKYRFEGKEKQLAFGVYPDTNLTSARDLREDARQKLAHGIDPNTYRKIMKASVTENKANSFEVIAREWFAKNSRIWSETYGRRMIQSLEKDLFSRGIRELIMRLTDAVFLLIYNHIKTPEFINYTEQHV